MRPEAGRTALLTVDREAAPHGYFLAASPRDILLPYGEADGRLSPGDAVNVFLFHDVKGRLTATMRKPLAQLGETALLAVADVHPSLGCFLDIGIGRDVLLPMSELPGHAAVRPAKGDRVVVVLDHDKAGRLIARAAGEEDLIPLVFAAPANWKNRTVEAIVYNPQKTATFVVCRAGGKDFETGTCPEGFAAFGMIHESERTRPLRLGETVRLRVARVREDGRVNLSMFPLKQQGLDDDAEKLLAYLKERPNGAMPYSDETPPDIIRQKFQISKAAFKRAIGKLMREGLVFQKGHWTHLAAPDRAGTLPADGGDGKRADADGNRPERVNGKDISPRRAERTDATDVLGKRAGPADGEGGRTDG